MIIKYLYQFVIKKHIWLAENAKLLTSFLTATDPKARLKVARVHFFILFSLTKLHIKLPGLKII